MEPKELKQWREANGYSQAKLAKALSCHVIAVSRWENGAREIPTVRLQMVLDKLDQKLRDGFSIHINFSYLFSKPQSKILLPS
jgi:transcriptional regulator with XRE-family HTH domain